MGESTAFPSCRKASPGARLAKRLAHKSQSIKLWEGGRVNAL